VSKWGHLYDRRWRKRRALQLTEHPLCRLCMDVRGRVTAATVADHVTPHRGDPVLFDGPLQSLCAACHSAWKQQQETTGHIRGCDVNGMPLDPNHPWRKT
jgi:5-methylcytosine-specific restriction enzyme A